MARVALLGGSFNPPHVAHQMIALWLHSTDRADEVWLMPCDQHPFGKELAPFEHRVAMCELACADLQGARVSRVEQQLGGESRTLETIQHLIGAHPGHEFSLVIGADILAERDKWHRFDVIERLVRIHVIGRAGHDPVAGVPQLPDVSSTEVRRRLAAGEDVGALVPAAVLRHIRTRGLYVDP